MDGPSTPTQDLASEPPPKRTKTEMTSSPPARSDARRLLRSYGNHVCLGTSLALLELRVMFEELMARLPQIKLATLEPPRSRPANFVVGIEELMVSL